MHVRQVARFLDVSVGATVECQDGVSGKVVGSYVITRDREFYEVDGLPVEV